MTETRWAALCTSSMILFAESIFLEPSNSKGDAKATTVKNPAPRSWRISERTYTRRWLNPVRSGQEVVSPAVPALHCIQLTAQTVCKICY